jgi:hypothetical protein
MTCGNCKIFRDYNSIPGRLNSASHPRINWCEYISRPSNSSSFLERGKFEDFKRPGLPQITSFEEKSSVHALTQIAILGNFYGYLD